MAAILTKTSPYDFWTMNGSRDFGVVSAGSAPFVTADVPIRLQRGDKTWGGIHIERSHAPFLAKTGMSAPELVWKKCQQFGAILSSEEPTKIKINLRQSPAALMVLRYVPKQPPFFTVVTIYAVNHFLDGEVLGNFAGIPSAVVAPVFDLPQPRSIPVIRKKSRVK